MTQAASVDTQPKRRVVAIDDEKDILKLYHTFLSHCGYEVHTADNAAGGLDLLKAVEPDLLLLDINMPGIDGIQTLEMIRSDPKVRDMSVFMVSARRDEPTVKEALRLGCDNFLIKPFKLKDLAERIAADAHSFTEAELRAMLRTPLSHTKAPIFREPGLTELPPLAWDPYMAKRGDQQLLLLSPKGLRPDTFARAMSAELERGLMVMMKTGRRWKKIWPKTKRRG